MTDNKNTFSQSSLAKYRKKRTPDSKSESDFNVFRKQNLTLENSVWFEKEIIHRDAKCVEFVNRAISEMEITSYKEKYTNCFLTVLANLHRLYIADYGHTDYRGLAVCFNSNHYRDLRNEGLGHVSYVRIKKIFDYLEDNRYVFKKAGYFDRENPENNRISRLYLKQKSEELLNNYSINQISIFNKKKSLIKMKDEDKISYIPKTPKKIINKFKKSLNRINDNNTKFRITISYDHLLLAYIERMDKDIGVITVNDKETREIFMEEPGFDYPFPVLDLESNIFQVRDCHPIKLPKSINVNVLGDSLELFSHNRTATLYITNVNTPETVTSKGFHRSKVIDLSNRFHTLLNLQDSTGEIDLTEMIPYTRNFTRDSFDCGGRFYHTAIIKLPRESRKYWKIDGQQVAELDFSAMHLRMLHHMNGLDAPTSNLYDISPDKKYDKAIIKTGVNMLLNCKSKESAALALAKEYTTISRSESKEIINIILEEYHLIAKHLGDDMGVELQRKDSDIAESVMLVFAEKGECCLGVHDSFIVKAELKDELEAVMNDCYFKMFSKYPVMK